MVIGHIYRALGGGGMQRGTGAILKVHHDMGHKIVLFTRLPPEDNDYKITVPYEQIVIGGGKLSEPATPERTRLLKEGLVRERFRVFASEGRLDENLALRPRERRLLDLVLAADSPERLREVFARERAEKKGNRK